ncbi:MAG: DUF4129 domain-containing protein [Chitinophagaceae bacterium]|nr:DUF4129 domain-containing protein [Chitinophagaceae bacterium]
MIKGRAIMMLFFLSFTLLLSAQDEPSVEQGTTTTSNTSWQQDPDYDYMERLDSQLRNVKAKAIERAQKRDESRRAGTFLDNFTSFFQSDDAKIGAWIVLALFVLFLLYRARIFLNLNNRPIVSSQTASIEDLTNIKPAHFYDSLITSAEASGNYPEAIRFNFLKLLATWSSAGRIDFLPEKTNAEYLSEIKPVEERNNFGKLAAIYERVWYGKFSIDEAQYRGVKDSFNQQFK